MESADSICYLVMDIEDGFNKKWYNFAHIKESLIEIDGMQAIFEKIDNASKNEITKVVNLRLALIKKLVTLAVDNFIKNLELICSGEYKKELIEDDHSMLSGRLRDFCSKNIFSHKDIMALELTGHSVLTGLLDFFIETVFHGSKSYRKRAIGLLSESIKKAAMLETQTSDFDGLSDYYKLRIIVDYISGMTDQFALNQYQKLSGQKIS